MSASFFKGNYDYAECTRSIDNMIEQFGKDRKNIISMLKQNPKKLTSLLWSNYSPVSKDDDCLFSMGKDSIKSIDEILSDKPDISNSLANFYICPQCKNMRRIIDFKKTKSEEPFILECGERAGSYLMYDETKIKSLYTILEKEPNSVRKAYNHPSILELAKCSSGGCSVFSKGEFLKRYANMNYLGSDPFTNNMLINWYLNEELSSHSIPNISSIFISWICNQKGYNLYEYSNIESISAFQEFPEFLTNTGKLSPTAKADDKSPISKEVVMGIIFQLFAVLHFLRKYDFSHGDPSSKSLKFSNEPVSYIIDGIHVTSPVTLKLGNFSSSGCSLNSTRLYSKSVVADETLKTKTHDPIIETLNNEVTIYRLKDPKKYYKSSILFLYMKHLGLPLYSASFDAYSFMIVCMCERGFYSTIYSDSSLLNFWKSMWINSKDFEKVSERIRDYHEKSCCIETSDVLAILSDLDLRCDMIDYGWELLKKF